ncbi:hypothetical protein EW145_g5694 [Phellinidium pouzarii]|uniref:non-specific serine/threonine protein kinase n=1 Tax=Phellinidium pouzarii TaxID=167371 RepID=A0A4S4L0F5_9AGAM|nr:hypothetical protein EW145_g5694 [Phellinidium pouzarii]
MASPDVHQLYKRLETVGKGAYGSVHRGVDLTDGTIVALKIINLDTADDDVGDIQREVALLAHLRDAVNITRYYGCYLDGPRVWIVMEYASGGSVRTLMKACKDGRVAERYVVLVTRELLLALAYLHKAGVIHRDIKAANILITAAGKVMLCDFGVSALLVTAQSKRNTLVGTPYWMAPEVAQPIPAYDTKADIWSLGITIYEMVTGSPPHSNLDGMKVVHLIPRSKPPRLAEIDGSKDLRDFVATCLHESPTERPTADELSRTKWIRSAAKTPLSVLKELLVQYDAWQQAGGIRVSIAEPLAWEEEEEEDINGGSSANDEQESWEFDTVRARSGMDLVQPPASDDGDAFRSPPNTRIPSSLRALFGDDGNAGAPVDPFRFQNAWSRSNTPTSTPSAPSSSPALISRTSPLPGSSQARSRRTEDLMMEETARQATFVFPPRPAIPLARAKPRLFTSVSPSDDEMPSSASSPERARLLPFGPECSHGRSHGHGRGIGEATMTSTPHADSGGATILASPGYREVRTSRGVPNIFIPPSSLHGGVGMAVDTGAPDGISLLTESPSHSARKGRQLFGRKRSQSSAAVSSSSTSPSSRYRNPASPIDFHFPPVSATANIAGPSLPLPVLSPSHASNSSGSGSEYNRNSVAHHATHSLDNVVGAYRDSGSLLAIASGGLGLPPSISRAHSANALSESHSGPTSGLPSSHRMSVTRQASVAVMESVVYNSASARPASPERIDAVPMPVPGLKDVLKIPSLSSEMRLGMSDLLPPSPSTASANRRFFAPTPSSLSANVDTVSAVGQMSPLLSSRGSVSTPPLANINAKAEDFPSPAERQATDVSVSTSSSSTTYASVSQLTRSHSHTGSSASSLASVAIATGPQVRPLDFSSLMSSHETTHAELTRTVDELVQWLGVVEAGLSTVLACSTPGVVSSSVVDSPSTFIECFSVEETYLEQVYEDDEDDDMKHPLDELSPVDDNVDDIEDVDFDGAPDMFEQFLANMEKHKQDEAGSDYSSEGGSNFSPDYTVHRYEQLRV